MSYEVQEYIYNIMSLALIRSELYKREKKFKIAFLHLKEIHKFSKNIIESFVILFFKKNK